MAGIFTNMNKDLEQEIIEATDRIDKRTEASERELITLEQKVKTFTRWAWAFVWFGLAVAVFGTGAYFFTDNTNGFGLNLLGDFLAGSVASLWSLAGLFFIYVAFLGQKQQLVHQQMEIMYSQLEVRYTRLELEGQKKEMIEQNKTLRQQRFENTFFQLLRNHQDIVNGIDVRQRTSGVSHITSQGRDCFKYFYTILKGMVDNDKSLNHTLAKYMELYNKHQSDLGHYFRNMYHILKFVENATEIEKTEKFKYTNLLRALLSSYELTLLFYNGLGEYGKENFKPLIERYSFLKNIDSHLLIDANHKNYYDERAFASSKDRHLY